MVSVVMSLLGVSLALAEPNVGTQVQQQKPVAVVELFTSEGCSSCPPADRLLAELIKEHEKSGDLIALSFHVDYWDNLGWKDPWSSAAATGRQQEYRDSLGDRSLYTPEMVLGGKVGFVGSDRARANQEIAAEVRRPKPISVSATQDLKPKGGSGRTLHVVVQLGKADEANSTARKWSVFAAVTERGLSSEVRRGENAGKKLSHENVVRVSKTVESESEGRSECDLLLPADLQVAQASLVVLVQSAPGRPIEGVFRAELSDTDPAKP